MARSLTLDARITFARDFALKNKDNVNAIFAMLVRQALDGSIPAARLALEYLALKPSETVVQEIATDKGIEGYNLSDEEVRNVLACIPMAKDTPAMEDIPDTRGSQFTPTRTPRPTPTLEPLRPLTFTEGELVD
jgi:hypothetical protein